VSENLRRYTVALFGLEHVIRLVPDAGWDAESPCEDWTAREVAGHAMGVVNNVAAKAGIGEAVDAFADVGEIAGDDPVASFRAIRARVLEALDQEGALQVTVHSALGDMSMDEYLRIMTNDAVVHTWDVARAAGVDETLDPDLVEFVHDSLIAGESRALRSPGRYAEAVEVDASMSAQDRMIAYSGRDPRRR
jgi:uncharacterized protein (TIGR03086 family)